MSNLKKYEEEKKLDMEDLEVCNMLLTEIQNWYEEEVKKVEDSYTEQLEQCEKELEVIVLKVSYEEIPIGLFCKSREEGRGIRTVELTSG